MHSKFYESLFCLLISANIFAQTTFRTETEQENANYYEIVKNHRTELNNRKSRDGVKSLSEIKAEKQFERWAYFWKDRVRSDGSFPSKLEGYYNAGIIDQNGKINQRARLANNSQAWENLGPTQLPDPNGYPNPPQMGRINTFFRLKHPTDQNKNILLVGSPSGGIWKSTDNGNTWQPKFDEIAGIGITDVQGSSSSTTDPGVIYITTGDHDGPDINSIGVYKSTDLCETFTPTALTFELNEAKVLSNIILYGADTLIVGTTSEIMRSTDGGNTWSAVFSSGLNDQYGRLAKHGNHIICTDFFGGITFSRDRGASWKSLTTSSENGRGAAVTAEESTGVFYILLDDGQVQTLNPNTPNPTLQNIGRAPRDYDSQGGYNQSIATRNGLILSGGVEGRTSSNNGSSWFNSLNGYWENASSDGVYVHSDHHTLGTLDDGFSFYSCHDGGLDFITYQHLNDQKPSTQYKSEGVLVTQIYSVAITPQNDDYFLIGNQDNDGYSREEHKGTIQWVSAAAGDGTATAIDYSDPNIRYLGSQNGGLSRTTTGYSGNLDGTDLNTPDGAAFVWPLELHTTNPSTLFGGFGDVYKSTNRGTSWTDLNAGAGVEISFIATHLDVLMAVGSNGARKSSNGGLSWTNLDEPQGGNPINSIDFDQSSPETIYVTVSGYDNGNKVYKTTNGGRTWTNISAGLPNILIKEVLFHQNQSEEILFLATELGVYVKEGTANWVELGTGLPRVIVYDIDLNYTAGKLVCATFGRGLWQIDVNRVISGIGRSTSPDENAPVVLTNPIQNRMIQISNPSNEIYTYRLYNAVGGLIAKGNAKPGAQQINIQKAVSGTHLIQFVNGRSEVTTQKILID